MDIIEKVIDDFGDGNIVNIQFVSFDEEQKQIEWSLKLREMYLINKVPT
jgi:hypothetical protein